LDSQKGRFRRSDLRSDTDGGNGRGRRHVREIVLFGLFAGVLIVLLRLIEYRFVVLENAVALYAGIIATVFSILGVRLGLRLTKTKTIEKIVIQEVRVPVPVPVPIGTPTSAAGGSSGAFTRNPVTVERLGITPRELDILEQIAGGLSNREIAQKLFVSENTVKTHAARLFDKLDARRRTQAVQRGKELGLIP
jgi:DNA-binding CsgD family transcriptional regulator